MNERNDTHVKNAVETATAYLSGPRRSRSSRVAGAVLGKVLEGEGGKVTGRLVVTILVILGVVGLAFVAYRLLVLDLILTVGQERG